MPQAKRFVEFKSTDRGRYEIAAGSVSHAIVSPYGGGLPVGGVLFQQPERSEFGRLVEGCHKAYVGFELSIRCEFFATATDA